MIEYPDERGYPVLLGRDKMLVGWIRRPLPKPGPYHFVAGDPSGRRAHIYPTARLTEAGILVTDDPAITAASMLRAVDHAQDPTA